MLQNTYEKPIPIIKINLYIGRLITHPNPRENQKTPTAAHSNPEVKIKQDFETFGISKF